MKPCVANGTSAVLPFFPETPVLEPCPASEVERPQQLPSGAEERFGAGRGPFRFRQLRMLHRDADAVAFRGSYGSTLLALPMISTNIPWDTYFGNIM